MLVNLALRQYILNTMRQYRWRSVGVEVQYNTNVGQTLLIFFRIHMRALLPADRSFVVLAPLCLWLEVEG
jgi:hypothetical protein